MKRPSSDTTAKPTSTSTFLGLLACLVIGLGCAKDYLEIVLLVISHKLGNFLSIQKINLEIIKEKCNLNAVNRLNYAFDFIERDFKLTLNILKNIENIDFQGDKVNVKDLIEDILRNFDLKYVKLKLKNISIKTNKNDLENLLYILIENSIKYSKNKIYIRMCLNERKLLIAIKNDIGHVITGRGLGLELAKFLAKKNNWKLYTKSKKEFLAILKIYL